MEQSRKGFTLLELIAVIAIISIILASLVAGYARVQRAAMNSTAQQLALQIASAWSVYLLENRTWPTGAEGWTSGMDANPCRLLGGGFEPTTDRAAKRYMDVDYPGMENVQTEKSITVRYGLQDPWGERLAKQGRLRDGAEHRMMFALDLNYDGVIDSDDCGEIPSGVEIRATACAWSWGEKGRSAASKTKEFFQRLPCKSW